MGTRHQQVVLLSTGAPAVQLKARLESLGHEVHLASHGEEAVTLVQANPAGVSLLLVDAALGNSLAATGAAPRLLAQQRFPVIALLDQAPDHEEAPNFACHACIPLDASPVLLSAAVSTANRLFLEHGGIPKPAAALAGDVGPESSGSQEHPAARLDKHETEMTLEQAEALTHIGHWSVNLVDGSHYHSDEIKRIFGYEPEDYALSVEEAINAYHPDDRQAVLEHFNHAMKTGEGYAFDLRVVQPLGNIRHVHSRGYTDQDASGKVNRVYGIFQDITQQVLTENALRESEASMQALLDLVHTAIVVHDKSGAIVLSNQMANRLLSPLTTEIIGKDHDDVAWHFIFEDGRRVEKNDLPVSRVLLTHEPVENLLMGRCVGDEVAWILVNGVPVFEKDGALSKVIISFVDVSERRALEQRLLQAEKLKATGKLAGGIAHDFNNQLMVMLSYAELLKEAVASGSEEEDWADGIITGISRSSELTKQLLAFARKGKYVVTNVDLDALIVDTLSLARHSLDEQIQVVHEACPQRATVSGDASQLRSAILSVLLNAKDAMTAGGKLLLATKRLMVHTSNDAPKGTLPPGEWIELTIQDTGTGMDANIQKQLFEPFFTTKEVGKGTGMSMASVYGTIENHSGTIKVESRPGAGTTIKLYLPYAPMESKNEETPPRTGPPDGRIMIIDDDDAVRTAMSRILKNKGYKIAPYSNGRTAVNDFQRSWKDTDLVLLDMIMPEMNGVEVFHALRAIHPDVKVVLISGYSFSDEAATLRAEGATSFLAKPVGTKMLLQTIDDSIGSKRAHAH